eukprot:gnl/Dysnectes_brevis/1047_a1167_3428.p1 GENE.gnl/Dysnectes_brevis/1047_a1167_3428~~gnl/Dysnectes_brevis/1047_a1167_3428.p1  ORF type:complete len:487 (+),score=172.91 gnl/Dysnectes_brevis/1047_a1167_3428:62-1462(+)
MTESQPKLLPAHLSQQLSDPATLHPLHPDVLSRQATLNIGTIGHVAHGKSTIVKAISGVSTIRFSDEFDRNITIKLGYANAKIYRCQGACKAPQGYCAFGSSKEDSPRCPRCSQPLRLVRHVSFTDCPGHDVLMATMLTGAAVMDAAMLLVAANEPCPQPQTSEHLAAVEIVRLKNIIILQNKIDLVSDTTARQQHRDITKFVQGTAAQGSPIIPISAQMGYNIDLVCQYICQKIPVPQRDLTLPPRFMVIRSFDVNLPGTEIDDLKGGIAGGSLLQGLIKLGDLVEVRPGVIRRDERTDRFIAQPILTRIVSLKTEKNELRFALPGGLIGMGTLIDPVLTRQDRLVGHVIGYPAATGQHNLPDILLDVTIQYELLRILLGVRVTGSQQHVGKLREGEVLMVNIGSRSTGGVITNLYPHPTEPKARIRLKLPVCAELGEKVALSRKIEKNWRLIGWGLLVDDIEEE